MPKVSVIIPCFNQGHYLDDAIDSVLQQTLDDIEIIVVNDGSTDHETNKKLINYTRPKTRIITTQNHGLAGARNIGIQHAQGDHILPLDADDQIGPTYLEIAVRLLDTRPKLGIVYSRAWLFGTDETEWLLPDFSLKEMLIENMIFCSAVFRKEDWVKVGGYDPEMKHGWEDYDLWLSFIEMGREVYRIPRILFHYRVSENSMVRSSSRQQKLTTFVKIFNKHKRLFIDNIEVWIDELFNHRQSYREAGLIIDQGNQDVNGKWTRKVDTGQCRLIFSLDGIQYNQSIHFHPADDHVVLKNLKIHLRTVGTADVTVLPFKTNADRIQENIYSFSSSQPRIDINLSTIIDSGNQLNNLDLVIELEYLAFSNDCFPYMMQTQYHVPAGNLEASGGGPIDDQNDKQGPIITVASKLAKNTLKVNRKDKNNIKIIKASNLFDEAFYLKHHPDIKTQKIDPLVHYFKVGWKEGADPNALFDTNWYVGQNPDCLDINPLIHFIMNWRQNRDPNPYFSISYYKDKYPECLTDDVNPLAHYLQTGWREGMNPNQEFDSKGYLHQYPDVAKAGINPLSHYIQFGKKEGRRYLRFFDIVFYTEDNPSIKIDPVRHYLNFGAFEGRKPNRFFDPDYYRKTYIIQQMSAKECFFHYNYKGSKRNYKPNALFDPKFYSDTYPEYEQTFQYPLLHYQSFGIFKGHYPCHEIANLEKKPTISIVTPVYNTDPHLLKRCIHSVLYQAYPHWELCLVDDGSNKSQIRQVLEKYAQLDKRIKIRFLPENRGISRASNAGVSIAGGEYIGFLDHDDELTLDCLYQVTKAINAVKADILYSDEDLINDESRYLDSFFKTGFNPELLLSHNYITHFLVVKKDLILKIGGLNDQYDGAQDFDLILRLTECSDNIHHIKRILYHWRATKDSTSINHRRKIYADAAGRKSLQATLNRRKIKAEVTPGIYEYYYRVERRVAAKPIISLIVMIKDTQKDFANWIKDVVASTRYTQLEIKCLVSGSNDMELEKESDLDGSGGKIQYYFVKEKVTHELNRLAAGCEGEYIIFLNQSTTPIYNNWIELLLGYAVENNHGAVGGLVHYPDSYREKMKDLPDLHHDTWINYRIFFEHCSRYLNGMECPQNVMAMSANLFMIEKSLFESLNGFDDRSFPNVMYDLDFCLRLRERGFENIYTPYCEATSDINPIFEVNDEGAEQEIREFQNRWRKLLVDGDPYYNINKILGEKNITEKKWINWYAGQ